MKHSFYFFMLQVSSCLLVCSLAATAQVSVRWDKTLGGNESDALRSMITTADGGYLLAGYSYSLASGDKSEDRLDNGEDYWIVKIDEQGAIQWDETLGGTDSERLSKVIATSDEGYLLGGSSQSDASGDKSEDSRSHAYDDYWIIKVDEHGNKVWDKTFGGNSFDELASIVSTADGGYLLGGTSGSEASGDKSEDTRGEFDSDYWIIKVDEHGNKVWDKTFGGSETEILIDGVATKNGGYILAGYSTSNASGDKSEDSKGSYDYWIIKIDESGNKLWDKTFGSNDYDVFSGIVGTANGGYLLAGNSSSEASGDKSEDSKGGEDFWIIKIDENGNKLWDKVLGGGGGEILTSLTTSPEGNYLLAGTSDSPASGDKSEEQRGDDFSFDYWIIKIDESGNKLWDKTIGSSTDDYPTSIINSSEEGGYLVGGASYYDASGDKSEDSKGGADYWIVKIVEAEEKFTINNFALIHAETNAELHAIRDGDVIDLATLSSSKLSIAATTEPKTIGSVAFRLEGPFIHGHTENYAPYALFGDQAGDFSGRLIPPGEYKLTATPYAEKDKAGAVGAPLNIHFTIINSDEIVDSQVTAFDLYDAVTDEKIMDLTDGTVIHTDELAHDELTVLMHTVPDFVGSVKVELWGPMSLTRIENTKPYALFRNNSKDLFGEALPAGEYTLKATPYTEKNAQGEAGEPLEISFTVVGGDTPARLAVHPVPTSGAVNISYQGSAEQADLMLLDFTGQPLLTLSMQEQTQLDFSSYRKGIYYIKVVDQQGVHLKRVVVE